MKFKIFVLFGVLLKKIHYESKWCFTINWIKLPKKPHRNICNGQAFLKSRKASCIQLVFSVSFSLDCQELKFKINLSTISTIFRRSRQTNIPSWYRKNYRQLQTINFPSKTRQVPIIVGKEETFRHVYTKKPR
jgi:hypothetical protein